MATQTYVDSVTLTSAAEFNKFDTAAYAALTGAAGTNTITATGPANLTSVATNPPLWFIPAATNTGATTINITPSGGAALGAKNVFSGGAACVGGEIVIGVPTAVLYDGTQYNLLTKAVTNGTVASTFTFNGSGGSTGSLTLTWQKIGNWVTLNIPTALATTGTGSTGLVSNTALAAAIRPTVAQNCATNNVNDNGAVDATNNAVVTVGTDGILTIIRNRNALAYTNTASGGLGSPAVITYFLG